MITRSCVKHALNYCEVAHICTQQRGSLSGSQLSRSRSDSSSQRLGDFLSAGIGFPPPQFLSDCYNVKLAVMLLGEIVDRQHVVASCGLFAFVYLNCYSSIISNLLTVCIRLSAADSLHTLVDLGA